MNKEKPTKKQVVSKEKPTKKQVARKRKETIKHKKILQELGLLPEDIPKKTIEKIKSGRPSKYSPALCIKLISLMAEGKSKTASFVEMGITEATAHGWTNEYINETAEDGKVYKKLNTNYKPDFLNALKIGEQLNLRWWEEVGRNNLHNREFNSTLYMMQMQNRHGWSRRIDGKIDINETYTEKQIREVVFKFDKEDIRQYIEELSELGIIEIPSEVH